MTWTAILYDGMRYTYSSFHGSPDVAIAKQEAVERFATFWAPSKRVVALVPGAHPVYS